MIDQPAPLCDGEYGRHPIIVMERLRTKERAEVPTHTAPLYKCPECGRVVEQRGKHG